MKIIIIGAGQVGGTLAENLASEENDITVIDQNMDCLLDLQDRLDIRTVYGQGSHPDILAQAGTDEADMLIAVANSDEVNLAACQVAYTLFQTPNKICRVRAMPYLAEEGVLFPHTEKNKHKHKNTSKNRGFPVDVLISPEEVVTKSICRLLEYPGALQALDFAEGKARLIAIRATEGGPLIGHELSLMKEHMPTIETRVAAIFRKGRPIIPKGNTVIEVGDEVFFIAATHHIRAVMSELQPLENNYRRIIIAGGGNIGLRLAKRLERHYQVKVIESNHDRCKKISEELVNGIALHDNAANKDMLLDEKIEETDVFISVTNDDEANIMASMLAKSIGARKVMALISNPDYVDLIQGGDIDIAISPQQTTLGSLLKHIRKGDVVNAHSLRRGAAEAIEAIAHGDHHSSKVIGRRLDEIPLPTGTTIGAIVRDQEVLIAHDHIRIQPDDHVILFLVDKQKVREVEQLFHVGVVFF